MKKFLLIPSTISLFTSSLFSQGTWTQKADFGGTARYYATGFSIGTKGYIGTGKDSVGYKNDFWEWEQLTNVWTQKADFVGAARVGGVGFSIGTKGYIGTGGNSIALNDFWEWNQATNVWAQKANFSGIAGGGKVGFSIDTKGYIGTSSGSADDLWEWNQATDSWTQKASLPLSANRRSNAVGFSIGKKGYIGTGWYPNATTVGGYNDFWEWDGDTASSSYNTWTQKDSMNTKRYASVGFAIGNNVYIGTGVYQPPWFFYDFWRWSQVNNTWTQEINFGGQDRYHAVGFAIGNKGYVGTGYNYVGWKKDFWEFDPNGNSVEENEFENSISVFPAPAIDGKFTVSSSQFPFKEIKIFSSEGKLVFQKTMNAKHETVNLNEASGIYFIHITSEDKTAIKKIVIS